MVSPGSSQISDPMEEACSLAETTSSRKFYQNQSPPSPTKRVMTFVMEATARCSGHFSHIGFFPVPASIKTAEGCFYLFIRHNDTGLGACATSRTAASATAAILRSFIHQTPLNLHRSPPAKRETRHSYSPCTVNLCKREPDITGKVNCAGLLDSHGDLIFPQILFQLRNGDFSEVKQRKPPAPRLPCPP